jgi:hypothetical protein
MTRHLQLGGCNQLNSGNTAPGFFVSLPSDSQVPVAVGVNLPGGIGAIPMRNDCLTDPDESKNE